MGSLTVHPCIAWKLSIDLIGDAMLICLGLVNQSDRARE